MSPHDPRMEKRELRRQLRADRRSLEPEIQARRAQSMQQVALHGPPLLGARTIAGYVASDGELDPAPLLATLRKEGAQILLPRSLDDGALALAPFEVREALVPSGPGQTLEPTGAAIDPLRISTPAVLLTPAVALDRSGRRLGRGGGAYDRLIPILRGAGWTILGVCHADHLVQSLPHEPHDAPVDMILTQQELSDPELPEDAP